MKVDFLTLDVETANSDMASICQIGIVSYKDGEIISEWSSLINPEDYFNFINVNIHGITENKVSNAPTFSQIYKELRVLLEDNICVCHTAFDRVSITRTLNKYSLQNFNIQWLDSAKVARRTWKECAYKGYGLANVCNIIGYKFKHHDALEDAKAAGQIILAASKINGLELTDLLKRIKKPIFPKNVKINREANIEGLLFGEVLVFTGSLAISRRNATDLATEVGCKVCKGVTKKTTLLVVGDQDISRLAGKKKSRKHMKAEMLIDQGQNIKILKESDFLVMVKD